jgi:hypothetical protein
MLSTQVAGEKIFYIQRISGNDTISSATWSVLPVGPTLQSISNSTKNTKVLFGNSVPGSFTLTVTITLTSGQIVIGTVDISVVAERI